MNQERAFTDLIKKNEGTIYKIIRSYATDPHSIGDLYQEVVYQLWKSFDSFQGRSKINTWLYRIVLNTILTQQRNDSRRRKREEDLKILDFNYAYDHELDLKIKKLYQAIYTLNDVDKAIILLHLESRSHKEISEIVGISSSNVGTRLGRIKIKLLEKIKDNAS